MELSAEESKEIYAAFGLTYSRFNILEHGVVNSLLFLDVAENKHKYKTKSEWENAFDLYFKRSISKTFGVLIKRLEVHQNKLENLENIIEELRECLSERNFLAHHFWRQYAVWPYSESIRFLMLQRLDAAGEMFSETTVNLKKMLDPIATFHGVTDEIVHEIMNEQKNSFEPT